MAERDITIKITASGELLMIDNDDMPLKIGHKQVVRASNVEWDEVAQKWFIWENLPPVKGSVGVKLKWNEGFEKRSDAIAQEVRVLTEKLLDVGYVESMFKV